jgi:hypothetical protein
MTVVSWLTRGSWGWGVKGRGFGSFFRFYEIELFFILYPPTEIFMSDFFNKFLVKRKQVVFYYSTTHINVVPHPL